MTNDEHGEHGPVQPDDDLSEKLGEEYDDEGESANGGTVNYLLAVAMLAIPPWLVYMGVKRLFEGVYWSAWLETATTVGATLVTFYIMLRLIPRRGDDSPEAGGDHSAT
jgi:hypothetical protein